MEKPRTFPPLSSMAISTPRLVSVPKEASGPATTNQQAMWIGSPGLTFTTPMGSSTLKADFPCAEAGDTVITIRTTGRVRTNNEMDRRFIGPLLFDQPKIQNLDIQPPDPFIV